jgi:hypothetical protein
MPWYESGRVADPHRWLAAGDVRIRNWSGERIALGRAHSDLD